VVARDGNMSGERIVIGVDGCHRGTLFGGEVVDLFGMNFVIQLVYHLHYETGIVEF